MAQFVPVVIVGGGPAGLACARALARRGVESVVLERRDWPIDKVCGEGLMPVGLACLERLGVTLDCGHPFTGIDYVELGGRSAGVDFAEGPGRIVRRLELSRSLASSDLNLVARARVRDLRITPNYVEVESDRGSWRCQLVVGADGLHSWVRHQLGWNQKPPFGWLRWGWRQHYACAPWSRRVEVQLGQGCEAYISPVGPDQLGVAVLSSKGLNRETWLQSFPQLRARLSGCSPLSPLAGLGPLWQRSARVMQPGVVLIGDASGYLDACTGEGLSLAFLQAEALAKCWTPQESGKLQSLPGFERQYKRIVSHYHWLTLGVLILRRWSPLSRASVSVLRSNPSLFQRLLSANQGLSPVVPLLLELGPRLAIQVIRETLRL